MSVTFSLIGQEPQLRIRIGSALSEAARGWSKVDVGGQISLEAFFR